MMLIPFWDSTHSDTRCASDEIATSQFATPPNLFSRWVATFWAGSAHRRSKLSCQAGALATSARTRVQRPGRLLAALESPALHKRFSRVREDGLLHRREQAMVEERWVIAYTPEAPSEGLPVAGGTVDQIGIWPHRTDCDLSGRVRSHSHRRLTH